MVAAAMAASAEEVAADLAPVLLASVAVEASMTKAATGISVAVPEPEELREIPSPAVSRCSD